MDDGWDATIGVDGEVGRSTGFAFWDGKGGGVDFEVGKGSGKLGEDCLGGAGG